MKGLQAIAALALLLVAVCAITTLLATQHGNISLLQDRFPVSGLRMIPARENNGQFPVSLSAIKNEFEEEKIESEFGECAEQWRGCKGTSTCQAIWEDAGLLGSWKSACAVKLSQAQFVSLSAARSEAEERTIESEFGECSEQWRACKGTVSCTDLWAEAGLLNSWKSACAVQLQEQQPVFSRPSSLSAKRSEVEEAHLEAEFGECAEEWRACKGDDRCEAIWEEGGLLAAWRSACGVV